ncbi:fungal-specific transcription factor domain-containing protein [Flammula alnicola]|nr:fungal-specific transcription factor domain-containing protein [Flammula alnicola]
MSSNEEDTNDGDNSGSYQSLKKRRIQRACDICRRKKSDGVQMPGNRCSNCIAYSFDCTYVETAKKRGPPKGLENRVEKLETLLRRLCPDDALYNELTGSLDHNWMVEQAPANPSSLVTDIASCTRQGSTIGLNAVASAIRGVADNVASSTGPDDDDDETSLILTDNLKRMALEPHEFRFFGKSSGAMLVRTALELKNEYTGSDTTLLDFRNMQKPPLKNLRNEFWTVRPWERKFNTTDSIHYTFPEPDLAMDLIGLYFTHVNLYLPLLHRPIFEKLVQEGLHLTNQSFAPVYLLVCAVGARYSDDPRAKLEGVDSYHSCGWKWFDQVQMVKRSMLAPPSLFDLQLYCLSVQFLQGSSAPQSCWTIVGIGIRLAQDVGAHRRKLHTHTLTAEDELWKRAFWVLVCLDRMISSSLGRPCAIQDEDFDLDLPIDCDDEYWENPDPEKCFKQPPNKPSSISHFILYLKLHQILAFSLRTIYSINKSKILLGFVGQEWEQHIVAELDSALNKWVDSVPDHLRWDPNREDDTFFNQSVSLYSAYYHIQILIHRPFIPSPSKPSPLSFPSLAICTNAARSCSHVIDIQRRRNAMPQPNTQMAVFTSGIVLLLSIWGGKRSGLSTDPNQEMADVHKCMQVLRISETRWHSAGRLWDILYELASVGELPLPQRSPPSTNKRERGSETPMSSTASESSMSVDHSDMPRNIAGSRRVNKESTFFGQSKAANQSQDYPQPQHHSHPVAQSSAQHQPSMQRPSQSQIEAEQSAMPPLPHPPVQYFALPVYSNELGRLPLHGQVAFSAQAHTPASQPPQPPPQTNYWYIMPGSDGSDTNELSPLAVPSPASTSAQPLHLGAQRSPQQLPPPRVHRRNTQPSNGYPPISEMSSMTQGYEMDAAAMAAGMMLDTIAGTLAYSPQNTYGIPPMDGTSSIAGMQGSYRDMSMDTSAMGDVGIEQRQQQLPPRTMQAGHLQQVQPEQQQLPDTGYPFVDNDTIAMWSTAPTGFE